MEEWLIKEVQNTGKHETGKENNEQLQNCDRCEAMPTSLKKKVQPRMNLAIRARK